MPLRRFSFGPSARRVAGIIIGLLAALITVAAVSVLTLGSQFDLIVPLCLFVLLGSGAVSLSRRRLR